MARLFDSIYIGSVQTSPSTQNTCTHGAVAAAPKSGFVIRCWNHGSSAKSVSARVTQLIPGKTPDDDTFQPLGGNIAIAAPGANESCEKAWACAISPTEFVVTWERQNTAGSTAAIECARVYLSEGSWLVDQPSAGTGYVIDNTGVNYGEADCNCRIRYVEDGYFFISYATETANTGTSPHERTYTLRTGLLSWLTTGAPTSIATKAYSGQHWDDTDSTGETTAGGYLLSHACVTARGDILIAWENRDHNGVNFVNSIELRLLTGLYSTSPLTELATSSTLFSLTNNGYAYRRPQLASLHPNIYKAIPTASGASRVIMAWGSENITTPSSSTPQLSIITLYAGSMAATTLTWTANTGNNTNADQTASAAAVASRFIEAGACNANYDSDIGRYFSLQHTNGDHEILRGSPRWIDRPNFSVFPYRGREYLFMAYEGSADGVSSNSATFIDCYRLDA